MPNTLSIIADVPQKNPKLGFNEYARALADAIRGGEPPQFTIGLYGAWGSGKTSLLNAINHNLSKTPKNVIPVFFDAWRYEKSEYIIVPLLHKIYTEVRKSGNDKLKTILKKALKSLLYSIKFKLPGGLEFNPNEVKNFWEKEGLMPLDQAFSEPFEYFKSLPNALGDRRIVVLIDDLDRCSTENVVSVLESINLIMDVPGFIFVLALDYDVLINAITNRYPHVSGNVFIQKMIQLPFRVPPLNIEDPDFLNELIPELSRLDPALPKGFSNDIRDISILAFKINPRQIKRLINSFLLLRRIMHQRRLKIDYHLLVSVIGLQLKWPSHYQDLQDSVLAGDKNPFQTLINAEDEPNLQRYSERFFKKEVNIIDLKQVFQLTMVVAMEESPEEVQSLTDLRPTLLQNFIEEIQKKGFEQSARSKQLYTHPKLLDLRLKIGKTVVRFEKKNLTEHGRSWQLITSYLITRETHEALKRIDGLLGRS